MRVSKDKNQFKKSDAQFHLIRAHELSGVLTLNEVQNSPFYLPPKGKRWPHMHRPFLLFDSRATQRAHTSTRSIGFCAIWFVLVRVRVRRASPREPPVGKNYGHFIRYREYSFQARAALTNSNSHVSKS
jgi:hypothetical protein